MSTKIHLAFLWHMHQPYYKDNLTGHYYLPWVRLHAVKGYYDMPAVLENFPNMRVCFNLTPSLLYQIKDYTQGQDPADDFLTASLKPADSLTQEDKEFILANFFMNNWNTVIRYNPRYAELLQRRGKLFSKQEVAKKTGFFGESDYRDLQVLFNLCWFGFSIKKKEPAINELLSKTKNYTEDDKHVVLDLQRKALGEIAGLYGHLWERGQIELTTSPFYHPILPLLYNGGKGEGYNWEEDAREQIARGIRYFKDTFGRPPVGMWPSEGSVSPSIVKPVLDAGIQWIATDEDILLMSCGGGNRDELIYKPYRLGEDGRPLNIVFRDKKLSDLIGFVYYNTDPVLAVEDFRNRLHSIKDKLARTDGEHLVCVILDGENPWENYPGSGEKFLSELYKQLSNDPIIKPTTIGEYLKQFPPKEKDTLKTLYAGSWINHDFRIWFGHEEDRRAWKLLDDTRKFLLKAKLSEEDKARAWDEIYIAEGSDWYWWYGDDFSSSSEDTFDFLFRNHLMNVYRIANSRIPPALKQTIKNFAKPIRGQLVPMQFIQPTLDGKVTNFYEWMNAGSFKFEEPMGAMQRAEHLVKAIYYGFDLKTLYLRVDFQDHIDRGEFKKYRGSFYFANDREFSLEFPLASPHSMELYELVEDKKNKLTTIEGSVCLDAILELAIPFSKLDAKPKQEIYLNFSVLSETGIKLEECPPRGILTLVVPDEDFETLMWNAL